MDGKYNSKKISPSLSKVRRLESQWKNLVDEVQNDELASPEYLNFEVPFIRSVLKQMTNLPDVRSATKTFAGTKFILKRAGLPSLILSIDKSGTFNVELTDGTNRAIPGIEFTDTDLYITGLLGLSSRENFLKAYLRGKIKIHGLNKFRSWAPDVLANILKIDLNDYHAIVCNASKSAFERTSNPPQFRSLFPRKTEPPTIVPAATSLRIPRSSRRMASLLPRQERSP